MPESAIENDAALTPRHGRQRPLLAWYYHRVLPEGGSAAVHLAVFERQVRRLSRRGYRFLDADELRQWLDGGLDQSAKYAMLSFDDGWADNWIYATPVLRKYGAKGVLALNTGLVNPDKTVRKAAEYEIVDSKQALALADRGVDFSSFLRWREIAAMLGAGVWSVEAHGHSHHACYEAGLRGLRGFYPRQWHWAMERALGGRLFEGAPRAALTSDLRSPRTRLAPDLAARLAAAGGDDERLKLCRAHPQPVKTIESDEQFVSRVGGDLLKCADTIEERLGRRPKHFFWPWGQSGATSRDIAAKLGYDLQFSTQKAAITPGGDPANLPRIPAPDSMLTFERRRIMLRFNLMSKGVN